MLLHKRHTLQRVKWLPFNFTITSETATMRIVHGNSPVKTGIENDIRNKNGWQNHYRHRTMQGLRLVRGGVPKKGNHHLQKLKQHGLLSCGSK